MDDWGWDFTEARKRLVESTDYRALREGGHELKDGVVLTSVSALPFEMSLKCIGCGAAFWFENLAWSTGGIAQWRLSSHSRDAASGVCGAAATGADDSRVRRVGLRV